MAHFVENSLDQPPSVTRSLWNNSLVGIRLTDEAGLTVDANDAFCKMSGCRRDDLIGTPFYAQFANGRSSETYSRAYRRMFANRVEGEIVSGTASMSSRPGIAPFDVESSKVRTSGGKSLLLTVFVARDACETPDGSAGTSNSVNAISYDVLRDVVFTIDRNGIIVALNEEFTRKTGWKKDEWLGKHFRPMLHPEDVLTAWRSMRDHMRTDTSETVELRVQSKTGAYLTGEFSFSPIVESGKCVALVGVVRNITERKEVERRLLHEHHLLRTLIDNIPDLIFFKDAEGRYLLNNKAHLRSLGLDDLEQTAGKTTFDFNPPDLAQQYHADEMRIMRTREPIIGRQEWAMHRDSGERRLHLTSKLPLVEPDGTILGIVGISRDVTVQKQIEESLIASETKYRNLFENAVQAMFQTTVDGHLLNANKALLKLLGYDDVRELAKVNMADLYVRPEQREEIRQILESKGYLSGVELELKRRNGKIVTVVEYSRALRDEKEELSGFEGILEDITVRKALELKLNQYLEALQQSRTELARLNGEKDKLFSVLSHDLRSPFGSILGFCEILLEEGAQLSEAERRQFVSFIQEAATDQLALVNRLLDWSRFESGRVKFDVKSIDLAGLVSRSINGFQGLALKKGVNLGSSLPSELIARGDEQFLKQVFDNLLGNALKFTPSGGTISIDLAEGSETGYVLNVKDTGIGIPERDLSKLFKASEKYSRTGLQGERGTGLGLAVCKEIMEKLGGTIDVESIEQRGTTFRLSIPKNPPPEGQNVLVVDDDEGSRVLNARYIKRILPGYTVAFATNGKDAVDQIGRVRPSAIVTDYAMPDMNGYELLMALKKSDETRHIPVIVITGDDSLASTDALLLAGALAVHSKPVSSEKLGDTLRSALGLNDETATVDSLNLR